MKVLYTLLVALTLQFSASATTCAGATVIPAGIAIPYTTPLICGTGNQMTAANAPCGTAAYHGGNEAVFVWTPSTNQGNLSFGYTGVTYTGIFLYQGCPTSGGLCLGNITSTTSSKALNYAGGLTAGVTYYIVIDTWPTPNSPCPGTLTISVPSPTVFCSAPSPICTGTPIAFTANAGGGTAASSNPGNNYGCLSTSPNPSWYYLKIATSGNLNVNISAASDVDYALWGPFASLPAAQASCNSYGAPISCSYSTSATELASVTGVTAGQVYILLVTNFANSVQTITVNQTGSNTATTDCSIVPLPVDMSAWNAHYSDGVVHLDWATEHEEGNRIFRIQRSANGSLWETIGVKSGAGNTNQITYYSFVDPKPLMGTGYYRLQQVDGDGSISYTPVLSATSNFETEVSIYPNPVINYLSINEGKARISNLRIIDLVGKARYVDIDQTEQGYTIDCRTMEAGVYFAEYTVGDKTVSQKFFVNPESQN